MNERIKELAKQAAGFTTDEIAHLERVHNRTYTLDEVTAVYNEKFAELLIKECGEIAVLGDANYSAQHNIHKHFGVE